MPLNKETKPNLSIYLSIYLSMFTPIYLSIYSSLIFSVYNYSYQRTAVSVHWLVNLDNDTFLELQTTHVLINNYHSVSL